MSATALMILYCDVKANYKKFIEDFLRSKQRHQLFNSKKAVFFGIQRLTSILFR